MPLPTKKQLQAEVTSWQILARERRENIERLFKIIQAATDPITYAKIVAAYAESIRDANDNLIIDGVIIGGEMTPKATN